MDDTPEVFTAEASLPTLVGGACGWTSAECGTGDGDGDGDDGGCIWIWGCDCDDTELLSKREGADCGFLG